MEKRVESKTRLRAKNPKTTTGGEKLEKYKAIVKVHIHRLDTYSFNLLGDTFPNGKYGGEGTWFSCIFPNDVEITWYRR